MVESASRSLEKPTPQKIEQLVNDLIDQRLADHQLDECDLTLRELRTIAERFRFTLMNMLHTRIAYPKEGKTADGKRRRGANGPDVMACAQSDRLPRRRFRPPNEWRLSPWSGCASTAHRSRSCLAPGLDSLVEKSGARAARSRTRKSPICRAPASPATSAVSCSRRDRKHAGRFRAGPRSSLRGLQRAGGHCRRALPRPSRHRAT